MTKHTDRMVKLGSFDGWTLSAQPWPEYSHDTPTAWWKIYLFKDEGKGRFYLAWNGRRFARSTEYKRAFESHPDAVWDATKMLTRLLPASGSAHAAHAVHTHGCAH